MQLKKTIMAGAMGLLMAGSTVAFAQLQNLPQPFVDSSGNLNAIIVVGADAAPSDVVGAIDVAARLGGETFTAVATSTSSAGVSISGEGKEVATTNTKIFLDDSMGKSGLTSTMTKDELATLLARGTLTDSDGSTSHTYQQFIYLTPTDSSCSGSGEVYCLEFDKPGSSSSTDPTYNFGRFSTSPTDQNYLYRTYISFDKDVNISTAKGETLVMFGRTYTIHSDSTGDPAGTTSDKLVLSGGGSDTRILNGGESTEVTAGGVDYTVELVAASDSNTAVVKVGTDQANVDEGQSKKIGGLDVFMERVFDISSTDPTLDSAKLSFGGSKITLQHGSKVKTGDNDDSVDGTYVNLTISGRKLSAIQVSVGGRSSNDDFLKLNGTYSDPVWKTFELQFPSVTTELMAGSRSTIKTSGSGDNLLQTELTDDRGYAKTITWAYKAAATDTVFELADSSNNSIVVVEGSKVGKDDYFASNAGDFSHLYRVSGISASGDSSSDLDLVDLFSGATIDVPLGTGDDTNKVLRGQTFYFVANNDDTEITNVTWGTGAGLNTTGAYITVFPTIKGDKGQKVAFFQNNATIRPNAWVNGTQLDLPTGAINMTSLYSTSDGSLIVNITAANKEDGTASVIKEGSLSFNLSSAAGGIEKIGYFTLGRTSTGGVNYSLTSTNNHTLRISVIDGATAVPNAVGFIVVEEKDDASNQYSVVTFASTETSGSNNIAIPNTAPYFTATEDSAALGSDSTITDYVDIYGVYLRKTTTGQDIQTIYYPDNQVSANLIVASTEATVGSTSGSAGGTVEQRSPITNAIAKLDTEVTSGMKTTSNLILVGGPAVNDLVAELATAGKTWATAKYVENGAGTAIIDYVESAFASGKAALVVAGTNAADTRSATSILQTYDTRSLTGSSVVIKSGVIQSDVTAETATTNSTNSTA